VRPYLENTQHKKGLVEWLNLGPEYCIKKKKANINVNRTALMHQEALFL
jgi:hypothetical protein